MPNPMCIFRDMIVLNRTVLFVSVMMALVVGLDTRADACSCAWEGPFLNVARKAPLVVWGKILRHHPGPSPAMDVLVLETLVGGLLDSGLRVQMGDGMYCRPMMSDFPPGSEWILALNGLGAKPGNGMALSHCGEYWLQVKNDMVTGSIDGKQGGKNQMPLAELRLRLRYPAFKADFQGKVKAGERFRKPFGPGFVFELSPFPDGWQIVVTEQGRDENLARLTPPLHFMPNPREIEGWQFLDDPKLCPSRSCAAAAGPANPRQIIFSPEVGREIAGPDAKISVTSEEIEAVRRFGRGTLTINDFALSPGKDGRPGIEWLTFSVQIEGGY